MKTLLLKKQHILFLTFIAFFSAQAQNSSDNSSADTAADQMQKFHLEFSNIDGPETSRELQLSFSDFTSDDYDSHYDTKNLAVANDDLNLILNGELMTMQAYGPITEDKTVPLVLQASGNYSYTIELTFTENMESQDIHLKDNLLGTYFDLKNDGTYEFSSLAGTFSNRFDIVFKTQSVALSQTDYIIEGLNVYYAFNTNKLVILNPKSKVISNIEVYDILGKSVYRNKLNNEENSSEVELNNLIAGIYIVRLVTAENGVLTKKIIVK